MLSTDLLTKVRTLGAVPASVTDVELLSDADSEIRLTLLPMLRTVNEEYLVRSIDVATLNGRAQLPSRAMGAGVRLVQILVGSSLTPLPRMDPAQDYGALVSGYPRGFYFDGGAIVCLPSGTNATLRIRYYARPGQLVTVAGSVRRITSVAYGATTTAIQTDTALASGTYDCIGGGPAHQQCAIDAVWTNTGANNMTVPTASLLDIPQVGDYLSLPDTTPLVALPEELSDGVVLLTAARYLRARGYLEEAASAAREAQAAISPAIDLLRPRSDGNLKKLAGGVLAQQGWWRGPRSWWGGW